MKFCLAIHALIFCKAPDGKEKHFSRKFKWNWSHRKFPPGSSPLLIYVTKSSDVPAFQSVLNWLYICACVFCILMSFAFHIWDVGSVACDVCWCSVTSCFSNYTNCQTTKNCANCQPPKLCQQTIIWQLRSFDTKCKHFNLFFSLLMTSKVAPHVKSLFCETPTRNLNIFQPLAERFHAGPHGCILYTRSTFHGSLWQTVGVNVPAQQ